MRLPLIVRPEARRDIASARDYYEVRRDRLGDDFVDEVDAALSRISDYPEMYALSWQNIRHCRIRRFPYLIHYRILPTESRFSRCSTASATPELGNGEPENFVNIFTYLFES